MISKGQIVYSCDGLCNRGGTSGPSQLDVIDQLKREGWLVLVGAPVGLPLCYCPECRAKGKYVNK